MSQKWVCSQLSVCSFLPLNLCLPIQSGASCGSVSSLGCDIHTVPAVLLQDLRVCLCLCLCLSLFLLLVESNKWSGKAVLCLGSPAGGPVNSPSYLTDCGAQITAYWLPLRYLVTTTPHSSFCRFPMSFSFRVPLCCQPVFYFLEYAVFASPWLMILWLNMSLPYSAILIILCYYFMSQII